MTFSSLIFIPLLVVYNLRAIHPVGRMEKNSSSIPKVISYFETSFLTPVVISTERYRMVTWGKREIFSDLPAARKSFLLTPCLSPALLFVRNDINFIKAISPASYLDPNTININGSIKFIDSYQHVLAILGKPQKVIKAIHPANESYYNRPFEYCYFKGLTFERYGDKVVFNSIDFRKSLNAYLSSSLLKFDSSIKIEAVERKLKYEEATRGTDMDIHTVIFIPASKTNNKNQWVLYFDAKADKLFKITYWSHAGK